MKVRLRGRFEAGKSNVRGWLRADEDYLVLAIEVASDGNVLFRIASLQGTPALFEASLFKITDPRVDEAWIVKYDDSGEIELVPELWSTPGFWEDFFDGKPTAVALYHEVLQRKGT